MTYRLRQVYHAVRAASAYDPAVGRAEAARVLSAPLLALFAQMRRSEQAHSLNVLHCVHALTDGAPPPTLAAAALLHDVGKTRLPLGLWGRSLPVAVEAVAPPLVAGWAAAYLRRPSAWTRPFAVYVYHPMWGAALAAAAGAAPDTVWLIAHHADAPACHAAHPLAGALALLQRADNAS